MYQPLKATLSRLLPALLPVALLCSCGIFTPRQSQTPEGNSTSDPLNFSELVTGTSYQFASLQFENLFAGNDSQYFDYNSGLFTKTALIQRLNQIVTAYNHIQVHWTGITSISNSPDSVTLTVAKYTIVLNTGNSSSSTASDSGGPVNFYLVQNSGWHIIFWQENTPKAASASFFSPIFGQ